MTIEKFREYVQSKREYFYRYPQKVMVYLHWTAGRYYTSFNDYHFCVDGDGDIINSLPLEEIPEATWYRNTGSIAIALCCCYNAKPYDLGDYPPTEEQIETLSEMMAVIADVFDIPLTREYFMTHGEAANDDGYGLYSGESDCRWDLEQLDSNYEIGTGGDILRGKAQLYLEAM